MNEIAALNTVSDPGHRHVLRRVVALDDGEVPRWRALALVFHHKNIAPIQR